jgi:hypothetical protein
MRSARTMVAVVKRTEGPFGKRVVEEEKPSVGTAPGICAEGEAIADDDRGGTDQVVEEGQAAEDDEAW